jgi:hypothetical protein
MDEGQVSPIGQLGMESSLIDGVEPVELGEPVLREKLSVHIGSQDERLGKIPEELVQKLVVGGMVAHEHQAVGLLNRPFFPCDHLVLARADDVVKIEYGLAPSISPAYPKERARWLIVKVNDVRIELSMFPPSSLIETGDLEVDLRKP